MAIEEAIKRLRIESTSSGVGNVASEINKVADAEARLTVESQKSERAQLSLENSFAKLERRYVDGVRQQQEYARVQRDVNAAVSQNPALMDRGNVVLLNAAQRLKQVGDNAGLARHELINLSRQVQDVGVSLASGQSPLLVAVQQGTQIADVFASSTVSVRSFFTQAAGWAGRFAASAAGVATAVAAIGLASVASIAQFAAARTEIDKMLASAGGAASGVNRGGIDRIAGQASSLFGLSTSEAREAATAFAATGKIYEENILRATLMTKQFAQAMGIDAAEATKKLAQDLQAPGASAEEWAKKIQGIDADTIKYIRTLETMGDKQGAINALIVAAAPGIAKQAENVGTLSKAWDAVSNSMSEAFQWFGRTSARNTERVTGINLGGFDDGERLERLRSRQQTLQRSRTPGLDASQLRSVSKEIEELEQKLASLQKATETQRFADLSNEARAFARALVPAIQQVENLERAIQSLEKYQSARASQGLGNDAGANNALIIARTQLALSLEQEQVEQRKAAVIAQNALKYGEASISTAQQLAQMNAQLPVAQAITGSAQLQAQYEADISQWKAIGKSDSDAILLAEKERELTKARITASAEQELRSLREQGELLRASSDWEKDRIAARQKLQELLDKGVDSLKAQQIAAQQLANADYERNAREVAQAEQDAARAAQQRAAASAAAASANEAAAREAERIAIATERVNRQISFSSVGASYMPMTGSLAEDVARGLANITANQRPNGTYSQFDVGGYESVTAQGFGNQGSWDAQFGSGNYTTSNFGGVTTATPNAQYFANIQAMIQQQAQIAEQQAAAARAANAATYVNSGLATGGAESTLLGVINGAIGPIMDQVTQQYIGALSGLVPEDRQQSVLEQYIARVQQEPVTLAREQLLKQLNDSLESLTGAVDSLADAFSPFYSSDPRKSNLGFRTFAGGGIMTAYGELPIHHYAGGGVVNSPQVAVFGEGSSPEAYVPVPNGRIPVEMRAGNDNRPIVINQTFNGEVTREMAELSRKSAYQGAQAVRRMMKS